MKKVLELNLIIRYIRIYLAVFFVLSFCLIKSEWSRNRSTEFGQFHLKTSKTLESNRNNSETMFNLWRLLSFGKNLASKELIKYLWKVQAPRLRSVQQKCKNLNHQKIHFPKYSETLIDGKHRLSYCTNRKAASTSLTNYIVELNGVNSSQFQGYGVHIFARTNLFPKWTGKSRSYMGNTLLFTVTRHPFRRLVSLYKDKIINTGYFYIRDLLPTMLKMRKVSTSKIIEKLLPQYSHETEFHKKFGQNQSVPDHEIIIRKCPRNISNTTKFYELHDQSIPTFREFILYTVVLILNCHTEGECKDEIDIHLLPQMQLCNPCILPFDYLLEFETLEEDFNNMRELLLLPSLQTVIMENRKNDTEEFSKSNPNLLSKIEGSPKKETKDLDKVNTSFNSDSKLNYKDYMNQLTELELDLLFTAYYEDFVTFGYDPKL